MIVRALAALLVLMAGLLAILDVGGTAADIAGGVAIAVALLAFDRAVFRAVATGGRRDEWPPRPS